MRAVKEGTKFLFLYIGSAILNLKIPNVPFFSESYYATRFK